MNSCLSLNLDKHGLFKGTYAKHPKIFRLYHIWQCNWTLENKYTYYSSPHKMYSKIDMCWVSISSLSKLINEEAVPFIYTDYNPTILSLTK